MLNQNVRHNGAAGKTSAKPRRAKTAKPKTGTSLIIAPQAGEVAKFAPISTPSRMQLNVIELSERHSNVSFKDIVLKQLGALDGYTVLGTDVLVATYIKSRITPGGIITTDKGAEEDRWQGKIGLVLKLGEQAIRKAEVDHAAKCPRTTDTPRT